MSSPKLILLYHWLLSKDKFDWKEDLFKSFPTTSTQIFCILLIHLQIMVSLPRHLKASHVKNLSTISLYHLLMSFLSPTLISQSYNCVIKLPSTRATLDVYALKSIKLSHSPCSQSRRTNR